MTWRKTPLIVYGNTHNFYIDDILLEVARKNTVLIRDRREVDKKKTT